jgi:hypothetical protein
VQLRELGAFVAKTGSPHIHTTGPTTHDWILFAGQSRVAYNQDF